mmetsp:Transcript_69502/g.137463  ORF Transcript_69502/g.137463 Transcript_69502/m.137463 type:complete len:394 (-) Transcript_69502:43-1224(-)
MKCWSLLLLSLVATESLGRRDHLRHRAIQTRRSRGSFRNAEASEFSLTRTTGSGYYTVIAALNGSTVRLVVDTASPWLWSYGKGSHTGEDDGEATQADAPTFNIDYLSAHLSGLVVSETLSFLDGAAEQRGVQSEDALLQQYSSSMGAQCWVGQATSGDSFWIHQWESRKIQGVLGLACGAHDAGQLSGQNTGQPNLQAALGCAVTASGTAESQTFSLQLHEEGGTLTFGTIPESLLVGLVTMPPSLFCGNWRIPVRVSVGTESVSTDKPQAEAILDSAALGIIGPAEQVASLAGKLGASIDVRSGKMVFTLPCKDTESIPNLAFHVGATGQMAHVDLGGTGFVIPDSDSAAGNCRLALAAWDSPQWLLGGPFFRQIRGIVFDAGTRSVSIAP